MELTLDQALRHAVVAHKRGDFKEAERIYLAILRAQPNHPDANHNLGVLAVSVGKPLHAIPLFESALHANPAIEQFWLSYIDVLVLLDRVTEIEQVLEDAKQAGVAPEKLGAMYPQIQPAPKEKNKKDRKGLTLSERRKRLAEKKQIGKTAKKGTPSFVKPSQSAVTGPAPSQDQINSLLEHYRGGRFNEAEELATSLTLEFPAHPAGWKVLGVLLKQTGRLSESLLPMQKSAELAPLDAEAQCNLGITYAALCKFDEAEVSYRRAIALKPDYAEAFNNLAVTLKQLGRLEEAEISYRQAISIRPNYAEAYSNLGILFAEEGRLDEAEISCKQATSIKPGYAEPLNDLGTILSKLGRIDEAIASYEKAIASQPEHAEAHYNLGVMHTKLGKLDLAIQSYARAITANPDHAGAYLNLALTLKNLRFNRPNPSLYPIFTRLLTQKNFTRPAEVAGAMLSLLKQDNLVINELLGRADFDDETEAYRAIQAIHRLPLLQHLMRICPLLDLQLEGVFVSIRAALLKNLGSLHVSPELTHFLSTLALQCSINEYVYFQTEDETELVSRLEAAIEECIARGSQPDIVKTLCLATYRPLHQYSWCEKLTVLNQVPELAKCLIRDPLSERLIAQSISSLADIDDEVSCRVREQYEESPYPRWTKPRIPLRPKSIADVCEECGLQLHSDSIKKVLSPSILIAGCGTGQHSIETASRFSKSRVVAVDLSLASLAYAQRKTDELGIANVKYIQADILKLDQLEQKFDLIESSGVLHHMEDAMAGWRILTELLNTGGLMKIGLYSELARRHIVRTRKEIRKKRMKVSKAHIRQFRQSLVESHDEHHQLLTRSSDFFSLSELRDLLFHVQERRFTLPEIQSCLDELGLQFSGFEGPHLVSKFRQSFGEDSDASDLSLWQQFEEGHPHSFAGMYQFWCQKM